MTSDPAQSPMPPTTTAQQDLVVRGQRHINIIWEVTQATIAVLVVGANMFAALWNVVHGLDVDVPLVLSSALFLIVGAYFQRTNHQRIGGIGPKADDHQEYRGR